jgi:Tfp pilus assembly protein PilF
MALLNLATTLIDLGQSDNAAKYFERVLVIEPNNSQAKVNLKELKSD